MLHTLLPESERKILRREYDVRLMIIFCLMLSAVGVIGIIFLAPTFIHSYFIQSGQGTVTTPDSTVAHSSSTSTASVISVTAMKNELQADALNVATLLPYADNVYFADAIAKVTSVRGQNQVTGISIDPLATTSTEVLPLNIILEGTAPTRSSLLSFKANLENLDKNVLVDLPVSELTKSTNISYSLRIFLPMPIKK